MSLRGWGREGVAFDVRLRGRIININSDHCFHCNDDGNGCKALCECIVVAVNPQMDKLLFAQSAVFVTYITSPSPEIKSLQPRKLFFPTAALYL